MSILVIAEHDNTELKTPTLVTVAAAQAIGGDLDILVAGSGVDSVAEQAAAIPGINKVIKADNSAYEHQLAENIASLVVEAVSYTHLTLPTKA